VEANSFLANAVIGLLYARVMGVVYGIRYFRMRNTETSHQFEFGSFTHISAYGWRLGPR
jgi:hypothetical protein